MATTTPEGWPAERPLAVSFHIMCEAWTDEAAPGVGPMGNPLKAGFLDTQAQSWARYGMTSGAWRLLDVIAGAGIPCTTYASGIIAERWPELLRRIDGDGHPIGAHSWAQNLLPVYQEKETEEAELVRGIEAFAGCHGKRPEGFISPRGTPSPHTSALLAKHGFRWTADVFDADLPYMMETGEGPLAAVPFTMEVNDLPITMRHGNEPEAFTATLKRILDGWDGIGRPTATLDVTAHAHVFGRPSGAIEFKAAVDMVKDLDWVWLTTHRDLADIAFAG
jgi:peptidoglycan/xylan/chitin deacetylase (PgdA/CDA1 family)